MNFFKTHSVFLILTLCITQQSTAADVNKPIDMPLLVTFSPGEGRKDRETMRTRIPVNIQTGTGADIVNIVRQKARISDSSKVILIWKTQEQAGLVNLNEKIGDRALRAFEEREEVKRGLKKESDAVTFVANVVPMPSVEPMNIKVLSPDQMYMPVTTDEMPLKIRYYNNFDDAKYNKNEKYFIMPIRPETTISVMLGTLQTALGNGHLMNGLLEYLRTDSDSNEPLKDIYGTLQKAHQLLEGNLSYWRFDFSDTQVNEVLKEAQKRKREKTRSEKVNV